jgi:hypothetical protein
MVVKRSGESGPEPLLQFDQPEGVIIHGRSGFGPACKDTVDIKGWAAEFVRGHISQYELIKCR